MAELTAARDLPLTDLLQQLEQALADGMGEGDGSHDIHHVRRVWINAQEIAEQCESTPMMSIVLAATYLHDLVNVPKNDPRRSQASRLSAEAAHPVLVDIGFSAEDIQAISHAIIAHSFSANVKAQTLEAQIVQDADRLESLGALGIARTFYTAGRMDSALFNAVDPFAAARELDDRAFAVDHFKTKLLGLPDTMQTVAGRQVAQERAMAMRTFLDQLGREVGARSPW